MAEQLDLDRVQALLGTDFIGRSVAYYESTGSTMDLARTEAEGDVREGAIVLADEQTAGRGRQGRSWISPPGVNLYVTLILRPALDHLRYLSIIAPLAVCHAIEETTGLVARIKWPNDVLIDDKKVCGVLAESEIEDEAVRYALVGIGVNVNVDVAPYSEIRELATSLRTELQREVSREEVLAAVLNHFEKLYQAVRRGEVVSVGWKKRLSTLGKLIQVQSAGHTEEGVVVDADSDGALILRRDDGSHIRIDAGEALPQDR